MKKEAKKTSFVIDADDTVRIDPAFARLAVAGFIPRWDGEPNFESVDLIEWCRAVRLRLPSQKRGRRSVLKVRRVDTRGQRQWCASVFVDKGRVLQSFSEYGSTPDAAIRALVSMLLSGVVIEED